MGAIINAATVVAGSLIGLLFKKGIPESVSKSLMSGLALCVAFIAVTGMFKEVDGYTTNPLITILSVAIGGIIGEIINIDKYVNKLGDFAESKMKHGKNGNTGISVGFVTATLLFCVGAMTVVGSIDSGLRGDDSTLIAKSILDGVSSVVFASSLGIGVMLSAIPILVLEGALTLTAAFIAPVLTEPIIAEMSIVGSVLILGLSLNMLNLTKIKAVNFTPAIFIPIILCRFM